MNPRKRIIIKKPAAFLTDRGKRRPLKKTSPPKTVSNRQPGLKTAREARIFDTPCGADAMYESRFSAVFTRSIFSLLDSGEKENRGTRSFRQHRKKLQKAGERAGLFAQEKTAGNPCGCRCRQT
jgi:hypothetical protein